jgi:hypothetical protein
MTKIINIFNDLFKKFLLLFLFFIWLSLDTNFYNLKDIGSNYYSFTLALRFIMPYLLALFLLIFYKKIQINTDSKILNYILFVLFFNFCIQAIALFVYDNNIEHINYILLCFFYFIVFINFFSLNYEKEGFVASILILFAILLYFGGFLYYWFFFIDNTLGTNLYGGWPSNFNLIKDISNNMPRSSGIARSAFIIFIPIALTILVKNKTNFIYCFFFCFCFFLILATQSRTVLFYAFFFYIIILVYIFLYERNLIDRLKKIFLLFVIPILFLTTCIELKTSIVKKQTSVISLKNDNSKSSAQPFIRTVDPKSFSSRRFDDWKAILIKNKNIFFGNGVMGDRILINQSASNIFLYNYASGGIISVILFSLVMLRSFFISSKIILFYEKIPNNNNILILSACFIQLFLLARGLLETSFAVFSIDFLMFFSSYFFSERYYFQKKT